MLAFLYTCGTVGDLQISNYDCYVVAGRLEEAGAAQAAAPVAASADAPAQAPASASADPAKPSQDVPAADFPMDNAVRSQAQSSGLLEAARDTGASAPRTGTGDATAATAQPPAATASGSAGPVTATAGTASGAPAHIDQPFSAYPVRALPARDAPLRPRSGSPAAAVLASAEGNNWAAAPPSDRPGLAKSHIGASERSAQQPLRHNGGPFSTRPAAPQATGGSAHPESHQQHEAEPAHEHQNGHQSATADDDDDADSLEDGEIEDGEVLPDGTIAGAADDMHDSDALSHANGNSLGDQQMNGHGASALNCIVPGTADGKAHHAVNKRKRSPDYDGSEHANGYDTSKAHALPQGTPA